MGEIEIQEKLEKIRAIAGIRDGGTVELDEDDLEEEFDPKEYDKKMKEKFRDDYYDDGDMDRGFGNQEEGDLEKPDFDKEDELLCLPKGWDESGKEGFEALKIGCDNSLDTKDWIMLELLKDKLLN